jgi:hypothetical protein
LVRLAAELEDTALVEIGDGRVPAVDGRSFGTGKWFPVVDPVGDVVSSGGNPASKLPNSNTKLVSRAVTPSCFRRVFPGVF